MIIFVIVVLLFELLDAFVTGIAGVVSVIFVWLSRRIVFEIPFKGVGLLFLIFFTFTLAQELSGFNRYMDRKKIIKGESIYTKMNSKSGTALHVLLIEF